MYIKNTVNRIMKMNKNTWKFVSMCFMCCCIYLIAAIIMLLILPEKQGSENVFRCAIEIARMSQAVMIICAIGSVIIEERYQGQD